MWLSVAQDREFSKKAQRPQFVITMCTYTAGGLVCDRKLNRHAVADIAAAQDVCLAPTQ